MLPGLQRLLGSIRKRRKEVIEEHAEELKGLATRADKVEHEINLILKGLDLSAIRLAETVLAIRGIYAGAGQDRTWAVQKAIKWFSSANPFEEMQYYDYLTISYYGTKDYDRWHGQGVTCKYGYGPSHGNVIFSIGLQKSYRGKKEYGTLMTDELKGACIYYLMHIAEIR